MGFSPLEAGLAFLPVSAVIAVSAAVASQLLPRTGPKIVMVSGAVLAAAGLAWLARLEVTSSYAGGILGPMLVFGFGMGFEFVSLTLMAVSNVAERESGAASGVLNVTQQVGGSLGLSILVTVFSTSSRNKAEDLVRTFLARATPEERRRFQRTGALPRELREQVLAAGITSAFIAAALMAALAALVAVLMIQTRAADLERFQGRAPSP
jgi:MFS family permease